VTATEESVSLLCLESCCAGEFESTILCRRFGFEGRNRFAQAIDAPGGRALSKYPDGGSPQATDLELTRVRDSSIPSWGAQIAVTLRFSLVIPLDVHPEKN
jgi:hypothetical protein